MWCGDRSTGYLALEEQDVGLHEASAVNLKEFGRGERQPFMRGGGGGGGGGAPPAGGPQASAFFFIYLFVCLFIYLFLNLARLPQCNFRPWKLGSRSTSPIVKAVCLSYHFSATDSYMGKKPKLLYQITHTIRHTW